MSAGAYVSVRVRVSVCQCARMSVCMYVSVCVCQCACVRQCVRVSVCARQYVRMSVCVRQGARMSVCACVSVCVRQCVRQFGYGVYECGRVVCADVSDLVVGVLHPWQHLRSYQASHQFVTVCSHGDFIVLSYWETKPPAP